MVSDFLSSSSATPRHSWVTEQAQYRLKVQPFGNTPAEFTVQQISFERDMERYERAAAAGMSSCNRRRGARQESPVRDEESLERSQRRAKINCRLHVTELAPTALVTFTTRQVIPLDTLLKVWQYFTRLLRQAGIDFEYVCVPERHPSNRDHFHLHAAYRGRTPFSAMRRLWHIALEQVLAGRKVMRVLAGKESPGNIDVQTIKSRDPLKRVRKIAKYVSKYITKDLIAEFNRRRYWPSKGINVEDAKVFWLSSLSQAEAIREACQMLGQWDDVGQTPAQRLFVPSERIAWCAIDPDRIPPPPF